ncbi:NAD-binding protein [Athelia psychrophila]|uniref:NAD-binding protein n=1 Tax=Athelia psychrophila TaxID=1759441 RepID=A0A166NVC6_9AGAM|nr:NAD-binding protein [Fibularhizoctonia sp. CBS 109695]
MSANKVVLVTGCTTGGIGHHLCEEFASRSCKVYATSRNVASMTGFKHDSIKKLAMDVNSDEDIERVVRTILVTEGKIDILINNAGVMGIQPLLDLSMDQVQQTFNTNTFSALRTAKAIVPSMAGRKSGLVVNIGSIVGNITTPWNGIYSASKAALHAMTEVLAMECRPFNVNVMLVAPGAVRSNIASNQEARFALPEESMYTKYLPGILARLHSSQNSTSMPTADFARLVVGKCLQRNPPFYVTAGGASTIFAFLEWLPRAFTMWFLWRRFSKTS